MIRYLLLMLNLIFTSGWANECPPLNENISVRSGFLTSKELNCRSKCKKDEDCALARTKCNIYVATHKKYTEEISILTSQGGPADCSRFLSIEDEEIPACVRGLCGVKSGNCETRRVAFEHYLNERFGRDCLSDSDCSFVANPSQSCMNYSPISIKTTFKDKENDLNFLRDRLVEACDYKANYPCAKSERPQCFLNKCILKNEKISQVNFVNYEGKEGKVNFASRTRPILTPLFNHISCQKTQDCTVAIGVCSQYVVTLNKSYIDDFNRSVKEKEKTIACPMPLNLVLPVPSCLNGFCLFEKPKATKN